MIKAAPKKAQNHRGAAGSLELARRVLQIEADAVRALIERIDERFLAAVELIHGRSGRVVVSGIGKSGHIARKIASTHGEHRHAGVLRASRPRRATATSA